MRAKDIKNILAECYKERFPKPIILGEPGSGKSSIINQLFTEELKVPVYTFQAMLYDPVEIKGLPICRTEIIKTPDGNKEVKKAQFLRFEDMPTGEDGVLFIDDLPHAPTQTQNAFMRLILEGVAGSWKLGNIFPIAAGNRSIDHAGAKDLQTAMANRFLQITLDINYEDWRSWAVKKGITPEVIAYLGTPYGQGWLSHFKATDQINPTPRSWEFVSALFSRISGEKFDEKKISGANREAIEGCIGAEATAKFLGWVKVFNKLPDLNEIVKGKNIYPNEIDIMYATVSGLINIAKSFEKRLGIFQRLVDYAVKMPDDFIEMGVWLSKDLYQLDDKTFEDPKLNLEAWNEKFASIML